MYSRHELISFSVGKMIVTYPIFVLTHRCSERYTEVCAGRTNDSKEKTQTEEERLYGTKVRKTRGVG